MFVFRVWYDLNETIPLQMQQNTWRCKANSHRYSCLGTASSSFLYILTMGSIKDAGCWKNRNSVLGKNPLYSFLIIKVDTLRETSFLFLHRPKQSQKRQREFTISMRWQPTCSTLGTSHSQTISSYWKHQWDNVVKLNLVEKGTRQNVLAVPL